MCISAWHKARGDEVCLSRFSDKLEKSKQRFDKIYISCIFSKNASIAFKLAKMFSNVEIGGYGVNGAQLPDEIEHTMPDYPLYGCKSSMGPTSRGCNRGCPWCKAQKIEGPIRDHAPIQEFHNPDHKEVILLDNNFIMSPRWRENWNYILDHGLKVCIIQGLDARLIDKETAALMAAAKHYNWTFRWKQIYTAWDQLEDEEEVLRGIQNLIDAGILRRYIMVYMLVKYKTILEQDLYRFKKLRELGVLPFVMPYNNQPHPLKRWGQRPALYKSVPFEEYTG